MDSLTHIVFGAAVGELLLGKKIGNKAMVWGAIANTIPDFDVIGGLFMNPLDSLVFHRGPMHSFLFEFSFPFLMAWLVLKYYANSLQNNTWIKWISFILYILLYIFFVGILSAILIFIIGSAGYILPGIGLIGGYFIFRHLFFNTFKRPDSVVDIKYSDWLLLFIILIPLHSVLDVFTAFGTQLLWPFSHHRFAISNISIADPAYTFSFLWSVLLITFLEKDSIWRRRINLFGFGLSCFYMAFTFVHKAEVNHVFEKSLTENHIQFKRLMTTPTILNNILWYGIAEADSAYYCGYYSLFDKDKKVTTFQRLAFTNDILNNFENTPELKTLKWFSNNFYNAYQKDKSTIQYNDLRYGSFSFKFDNPDDFIFHFNLSVEGSSLILKDDPERPKQSKEELQFFWQRLKGI